MALKILRILDDSDHKGFYVALEFKIDFEKEGFLAQKILRALMSSYSVESSFGFDKNFNEVLAFEYACGKALNRIIYDSFSKQYKHMVIKK